MDFASHSFYSIAMKCRKLLGRSGDSRRRVGRRCIELQGITFGEGQQQTPLYLPSPAGSGIISLISPHLTRRRSKCVVDSSRHSNDLSPSTKKRQEAWRLYRVLLQYSADTAVRVGSTQQTPRICLKKIALIPRASQLIQKTATARIRSDKSA